MGGLPTLGGSCIIHTNAAIGCSPWHSTGIVVHFSGTPDRSSSRTQRKYPRGYVVRDTIIPGGHIRWVCVERLVLWKDSMSSLRLGARKDGIFICAAPVLDMVLSKSIYLSTCGDSWDFHRSQQPPVFICLYTLLVNSYQPFRFFILHSFQPPPQGVQSYGTPFKWHGCRHTAISCGRLRPGKLQTGW